MKLMELKDSQQNPKTPVSGSGENRLRIIMLIGLVVLLLAGIFVFFVYNERVDKPSGGDEGGSNIATMIPIWVAVFIPWIVKRRKGEKKELNPEQKRWVYILLAVTVLLVVGTLIWLFVYN